MAFEPQDHEEKRAIVQLRLERAMAEQNISRVQQLSRELDELEGCSARNAPSGGCQPARFAIDSEPNGPHVDTRTCRESHTTNVNVSSATVHPDARLPSNIPSSRGAGVRAQQNACARLYEMPRTLFHPTIAAQFLSAPIVSAALVQSTNIVNLLMCLAMTEPVTPSTLGRRLSHCAIQIW